MVSKIVILLVVASCVALVQCAPVNVTEPSGFENTTKSVDELTRMKREDVPWWCQVVPPEMCTNRGSKTQS